MTRLSIKLVSLLVLMLFFSSCKQTGAESTNSENPPVNLICESNEVSTVSCISEVSNAVDAQKSGVCNSEGSGFNYGSCIVSSCASGYEASQENTACILASTSTPHALSDDVFFVGHSLVGVKMPVMLKAMINDGGGSGVVGYQVINGSPLVYNWDNSSSAQGSDSRVVLPQANHEVLVITEAVPLENHTTYSNSNTYAFNFYNLAVNARPTTRVFLYETWHCILSGTPTGCDYDNNDHIAWRQRLDDELPRWQGIADYVNTQKTNGQPTMNIIPAGQAMALLYDEIQAGRVPGISNINEIFSDDIHPNDLGFYFVSMVQYAAIYARSPVGLPRVISNGSGGNFVSPSVGQAAKFQAMAWEVVCSYPRSGVSCGQ